MTEIAQNCAEKDGDEIKTTENGNIVLKKDKISEWNDKFADFSEMGLFVQRCGIGSVLMELFMGHQWI